MRELIWSKTFIRVAKKAIKKNPKLSREIESTLNSLVEDPFAPKLETHKLKGKLSGSWACSIDHHLRIVFEFVSNKNDGEEDIFLIDIGTHNEVY
jgi:addiction module RelE/StbE family toxin